MTTDNLIVGVVVAIFALFGASLLAVSIYARSTPQPRTRAVARAGRPGGSARPLGPYRRAA